MIASRLHARPLLAWALVGVIALSGCGGSAPKPDPTRLARLVAEANSLCRGDRSLVRHARLEAIEKAAEYLPAGKKIKEAHAERRALEAKRRILRTSGGVVTGTVAGSPDFVDRFYRLQTQIYDSLKALGLTPCLGKPPRRPIGG